MSNEAATLGTPVELQDLVDHRIRELPILIFFPHNRCNCRCLMCDIWKIREMREITSKDLEPHMESLRALKVRWVVFSGGEPLLHSDLASLARMFRSEGIRLTLLTAGLLLEKHAENVAEWVDDVIVSIDGPPEVHDAIRGVPRAFERLARGIFSLRQLRHEMPIHGRCTVQKNNFRHLRDTVRSARETGLSSISFLAADIASEAFNRPLAWTVERRAEIALGESEVEGLDHEIEALIADCRREIEAGFVSESPEKLRRIVRHFRAILGQTHFTAPRCNAPWVSAVVEADGAVRPCFFHHPIGNLRKASLAEVLNSNAAVEFRGQLDIANNPVCQSCVCSLYLNQNGPGS